VARHEVWGTRGHNSCTACLVVGLGRVSHKHGLIMVAGPNGVLLCVCELKCELSGTAQVVWWGLRSATLLQAAPEPDAAGCRVLLETTTDLRYQLTLWVLMVVLLSLCCRWAMRW
jgi:hypothetical protein